MKRLFFALAILFSAISFSAFANDITVNSRTLKTFETIFADATNVVWSSEKKFSKADFMLNSQQVSAFFNQEGELIGTGRRISNLQLPIFLQVSLKNKAVGYIVTEVLEVNNEEGTHYYSTLESATKTLIVKSNSTNDWNNYKRIKK
jgi:hypothetical protein